MFTARSISHFRSNLLLLAGFAESFGGGIFAIRPNMPCPAKAASPNIVCLIQTDPLPNGGWWVPFNCGNASLAGGQF
jgi:hypothetical protein